MFALIATALGTVNMGKGLMDDKKTTCWIRNVKANPPPEGELVEVTGTDAYGEWLAEAYRKDYKPGSTKKQLRRKWRWMQGDDVFEDVVEAWRPIAR